MNIKNRKKELQKLAKQADEQALIKKLAQEAPDTNSAADAEAYAKETLKRMLEATDFDLPTEFDPD